MRRIALILAALGCALHVRALEITRNGITWTITGTPTSGVYANGDPWVVGPITITAISPTPSAGVNGTVVNPALGSTQGYVSGLTYNTYSESLNVGNNLPLEVAADSSVCSTITNASATWGKIEDMAILTVVSESPAADSFRPGYIGAGSRASSYTTADLDYAALNSLDRSVLSSVPSLSSLVERFGEPWYEQDLGWTGRYLHLPYMGVNGYGGNMADQIAQAALSLNLDYTIEEKATLLIHIVQLGLDYGHIIARGGVWGNDGGHNNGRLAPVLLAGKVLGDATLLGYCSASQNKFSEFQQTFFVTQADVDRSHTGINGYTSYGYASADIGKPEWGATHHTVPAYDNDRWDTPYRDSAGGRMVGAAGVIVALGAQSIVGADDALMAYARRHLYYRQSRFVQEANYNGYDDGVAYGTLRDSAGRHTANEWATPFAFNEVDAFAASFWTEYEDAAPPGDGGDTEDPVVTITDPTSEASLATSTSPLTIGGTATDAVGVAVVMWANSAGGRGTASGATGWSFSATLAPGSNVLTVTAHDTAGNVGSDQITVMYSPPAPPPLGSATAVTLNAGTLAVAP
jgi:hypothetical protein